MLQPDELGPVEILAVGFADPVFDRSIIASMIELADQRVIRVLDLLVVARDQDGAIEVADFDTLDASLSSRLQGLEPAGVEILGDDDVELAAAELAPGTAAAIVVWENLWARSLAGALRSGGGVVLAHER